MSHLSSRTYFSLSPNGSLCCEIRSLLSVLILPHRGRKLQILHQLSNQYPPSHFLFIRHGNCYSPQNRTQWLDDYAVGILGSHPRFRYPPPWAAYLSGPEQHHDKRECLLSQSKSLEQRRLSPREQESSDQM